MNETYIGNIQYVDHQPIQWDSGKLQNERMSHKEHACHMDHTQHKDLSIGWKYRLGCLDNQDQLYIPHQRLGHIGCKDLLYSQVGIYIELCEH